MLDIDINSVDDLINYGVDLLIKMDALKEELKDLAKKMAIIRIDLKGPGNNLLDARYRLCKDYYFIDFKKGN